MKTIKATDITILLKTENIKENLIEYYTDIKTDIAMLILFKRKKPMLFMSSLEKQPKRNDLIIDVLNFKKIQKVIEKEKPKIIGTNNLKLTIKGKEVIKKITPKGIKFKDISKEVAEKTSIKSPEEIKILKKSVNIAEEIIQSLFKEIKNMTYEQEAIRFLLKKCIDYDVKPAFNPLVATGTNAANPHYYPNPKSKLKKGFCIIDFGVNYKNFCSDITRTIYLGKPNTKEINFYKKVLDAQIKVEKEAKPNKKIMMPFEMIHLLGHGIGLEVHENPMLPNESIKKNMCVAIEPGLYTKEMSVRIEDDFVMMEKGLKRLTKSSRELITVNKR